MPNSGVSEIVTMLDRRTFTALGFFFQNIGRFYLP